MWCESLWPPCRMHSSWNWTQTKVPSPKLLLIKVFYHSNGNQGWLFILIGKYQPLSQTCCTIYWVPMSSERPTDNTRCTSLLIWAGMWGGPHHDFFLFFSLCNFSSRASNPTPSSGLHGPPHGHYHSCVHILTMTNTQTHIIKNK